MNVRISSARGTRFLRIFRSVAVLAFISAGRLSEVSGASPKTLPIALNLFGDDMVVRVHPEDQAARLRMFFPDSVPSGDPAYGQVLLFQDGRQFRGRLVSMRDGEIFWKRPDAPEVLRFSQRGVRSIVLSSQTGDKDAVGPAYRDDSAWMPVFPTVKLGGADWLFGDSIQTDGPNVRLYLEAGVAILIPRNQIEWIAYGSRPAPAYGYYGNPIDLTGWNGLSESAAPLVDADGTMTMSDGWLSRAIATPARFQISFQAPATSSGQELWLQPFQNGPNSFSKGTAKISFEAANIGHVLYVNKYDEKKTPIPFEANEGDFVEYRVLYDAIKEHFYVIRNGVMLIDYPFREPIPDAETNTMPLIPRISSVVFGAPNAMAKTAKITKLKVEPWDGMLPVDGAQTLASEMSDEITGGKGGPVRGIVESINDGEIFFSGVPRRMMNGELIRFPNNPAPMGNPQYRLVLGGQGEVSAADLRIEGEEIICRTSYAAEARFPIAAIHTVIFPVSPPVTVPEEVLVFRNGDELAGALQKAATEGDIEWKMEGGQKAVFRRERIAGVRFAQRHQSSSKLAALELRNGDRLFGEAVGMDLQRIVFRTSAFSPFQIDRKDMWRYYPDGGGTLFDSTREVQPVVMSRAGGTVKMNASPSEKSRGWIILDGHFTTRGGASPRGGTQSSSYLTAPLKRAEDRFELSFLATRPGGGMPSLQMSLRGKSPNLVVGRQNQPFADISIAGVRVSVLSMPPKGERQPKFKQFDLSSKIPRQTSRVAIRLFVDSGRGTLDIYLNGLRCGDAGRTPEAPIAGIGDFLQITPDAGSEIISDLRITPWDGELPADGSEEQRLILRNGDISVGGLGELQNGQISTESDIGPLTIPLERIETIDFGGWPDPPKCAARARLADGSVISFASYEWDGSRLAGKSAMFGSLEIAEGLLQEIIFDPLPMRFPQRLPPNIEPSRTKNEAEGVVK